MTHITGFERSQLLLLPEAIDDYVGPDNSVRFIDAFVDGLGLAKAGFARVAPEKTGQQLHAGLMRYIRHYNFSRPHSSLAGRTPNEVYHQLTPPLSAGLVPEIVADTRMAA